MQCDAMKAQLGLAQAEIKAAEANACRPMHHLPSLANQHIVPRPAGPAAAGSVSLTYHPLPMQQHWPHANKSILHPINVFRKYMVGWMGADPMEYQPCIVLGSISAGQDKMSIVCEFPCNVLPPFQKKCNSRFLKIQIILSLIKFILKITNICIVRQI